MLQDIILEAVHLAKWCFNSKQQITLIEFGFEQRQEEATSMSLKTCTLLHTSGQMLVEENMCLGLGPKFPFGALPFGPEHI